MKGQDDLRQDAVMQQVFVIMNSLLSANNETKDLFIRTYKIVPLSMRSGILEWVDNSMPIGLYLVGDDDNIGAHQKYRHLDKSPNNCKLMIKVRLFSLSKLLLAVVHKFTLIITKLLE